MEIRLGGNMERILKLQVQRNRRRQSGWRKYGDLDLFVCASASRLALNNAWTHIDSTKFFEQIFEQQTEASR